MHVFRVPASVFVAGASQSGKTTLVRRILENLDMMTSQPISKIIYYHTIEARNLPRDLPNIEFREGGPDLDELMYLPGYKCIIIDDALGYFMENKQDLIDLFTKVTSHAGCLVFLIVQSLFKLDRTARANSQYILLTRSSADKLQVRTLAQQVFPEHPRLLTDAYRDAVEKKPYGHLLLDLHPLTPPNEQVLTDIFDALHSAYVPKSTKIDVADLRRPLNDAHSS